MLEFQAKAEGLRSPGGRGNVDPVRQELLAQAAAHRVRAVVNYGEQHGALLHGKIEQSVGIAQGNRLQSERACFVEEDVANPLEFAPQLRVANEDSKPAQPGSSEIVG